MILNSIRNYKINKECQIKDLNKIYKDNFGYVNNGTFVEVGAYDGERWSNTSGLADAGWTGLYIEPVKEYYENCLKRHRKNKKVTVLNLGIGDEKGALEIFKGESLSTFSKKQVTAYGEMNWSKHIDLNQKEICEIQILDSVLENNTIKKGFEVLVVDVEGFEQQVLNSFNINFWKPKLIIIELLDGNKEYINYKDTIASHKAIRYKLKSSGYDEIYVDEINTIFRTEDF